MAFLRGKRPAHSGFSLPPQGACISTAKRVLSPLFIKQVSFHIRRHFSSAIRPCSWGTPVRPSLGGRVQRGRVARRGCRPSGRGGTRRKAGCEGFASGCREHGTPALVTGGTASLPERARPVGSAFRDGAGPAGIPRPAGTQAGLWHVLTSLLQSVLSP